VFTTNKQTGAITSISNFKDPDKMNWVISSSDGSVSWQKQNQDWGLGNTDLPTEQSI
jgi:hypothetical protein